MFIFSELWTGCPKNTHMFAHFPSKIANMGPFFSARQTPWNFLRFISLLVFPIYCKARFSIVHRHLNNSLTPNSTAQSAINIFQSPYSTPKTFLVTECYMEIQIALHNNIYQSCYQDTKEWVKKDQNKEKNKQETKAQTRNNKSRMLCSISPTNRNIKEQRWKE